MMLEININSSGSAFATSEAGRDEVARILRDLAEKIETDDSADLDRAQLRDINGNPVGVVSMDLELPYDAMRDWFRECDFPDLDEDAIDEMTDAEALAGVRKHYDGGLAGFLSVDAPLPPVGAFAVPCCMCGAARPLLAEGGKCRVCAVALANAGVS